MAMPALVTGGAGFIGSTIVRLLIARGHAVTVLDNLSSGYRSNLDGLDIRWNQSENALFQAVKAGTIDEDPDADTGGCGLFGSLEHPVADGHLLGVHLLDAYVRIGSPSIQGGLQSMFRNVSHGPGW